MFLLNNNFSNKLTELRKKKGYSQEELAEKLGLSRQAISKWERGESSPDLDNIIQLAKLYEISFNELFCVNEEKEEIIKEVEVENNYLNYLALFSLIFSVVDLIFAIFVGFYAPVIILIVSGVVIILGILGIYLSLEHNDSGKTISIMSIILTIIAMIYVCFTNYL